METKTAIKTSIHHSSFLWTWDITDVHLNHDGHLEYTGGDYGDQPEWYGSWNPLTSDMFEVGAGTTQHSRWKFSVTKRDIENNFDDGFEDGLALGIHFLGFVENGNGANPGDQRVKCLFNATVSGLNSKNQRKTCETIRRNYEFSTEEHEKYEGFFLWSTFCSQQDSMFADHVMRIQYKLTLIGDTVTKTVLDFVQLSREETQTMENDYGKFYNNPELSDFTIILSQESGNPVEFFAHKFILGARSPVFQRMLHTPMRETLENKLTIKDMDLPTLSLMLQFIYKGTIEIPEDKLCIFGLLNAAKMYDLKGLSKLIALKLQSLLTDENIGELTVAAYEGARGHDEVISVLRDYCQRRQGILWKNPEYKNLFLQNPAACLGD